MKLFCSEFKKLTGIQYIAILLCVLLAVNIAIAFVNTSPSATVFDGAELVAFYSAYEKDRDTIDRNIDEAIEKRIKEYFTTGTMPEIVSMYTVSPYHNDDYLRINYLAQEEHVSKYESNALHVVRAANKTIEEYDFYKISPDEYAYRYQVRAAEIYSALAESVTPELIYPDAWESYFSSPYVNIFLFIAVIVIAGAVFLYEKDCHSENILRTTRRGRAPVLISKLACIAVCVLVMTVLFTVSNLSVYIHQGGLTAPNAPIQSLSDFELCPLEITIGQFVLIQTVYRFLCALVFAYTVAAISLAVKNHVLTYTLSALFFAANAVVSSIHYEKVNSPLRCFNLYNTASAGRFFNRYIAQSALGEPVSAVYVCLFLYLVLTLVLCIVCGVLYSVNLGGIRLPSILKKRKKSSVAVRPVRVHTLPVFLWELKKIFASPKIAIFVLAVLAIRFASSAHTFEHHKYFDDEVFKSYITQLEGEATEEKFAMVEEWRAKINSTLNSFDEKRASFLDGSMSEPEYMEFMNDYYSAVSEDELFRPVEERASYLRNQIDETGVKVHFIYDTGIKKLLCGDVDLYLYIAIVVLLTQTFVIEYSKSSSSGGFAQIMRTTERGRGRTFAAKLTGSAMICAFLSIICSAADIIILAQNYDLSNVMSAPLLSVPAFVGMTGDITILEYTVFMIIFRIISAVILSVIVCSASALLRQYVPVLTSVCLATLIPHTVAEVGLDSFYSVSYVSFFDVNKLFYVSKNADFAGDFTFFVIFAACTVVVSSALAIAAYRRFAE